MAARMCTHSTPQLLICAPRSGNQYQFYSTLATKQNKTHTKISMLKHKITTLLSLFTVLDHSLGGVLIWGSESIQLPSLKQFNNEDFDLLKSYMRRPKVVLFRGDPMQISDQLQDLLRNKYTAYVPSSNLNIDNAIELNGDPATNFKSIQDTLDNCSRLNDNILALILTKHEAAPGLAARSKREAVDEFTTDIPETTTPLFENYEPVTGPVLYQAETTTKEVAMIYSSRTPVLKINSTSFNLGKAAFATVDDRGDKYRQLSVAIPMESGDKVTLRFKFLWNAGYWYLNNVNLLYISTKTITLSAVKDEISAAKSFSYHCSGTSTFQDEDNEIELILFDVQAQPDATKVRFSDAYSCIYFTTIPIWSGLFVASIMIFVVFIGILAMLSIKTMDKFDNNKTKQLTIATSE